MPWMKWCDSSEVERILPNPRQRRMAGSAQSSVVNLAEKEESFHIKSNSFEFDIVPVPMTSHESTSHSFNI